MVGFANSAYKVGRNEANTEAGGLSSSFHYEDGMLSGGQGEDSDSYSEDSEGPLPPPPSYTSTQDRYGVAGDLLGTSLTSLLIIIISDLTSAR